MATAVRETDWAQVRRDWQATVEELVEAVAEWARARGWHVTRGTTTLSEGHLGAYEIPDLVVETPEGEVMLEPKARDVYGGDGRVDLYAWPSLHRVMLIRRYGGWVVRTDSGIDWPEPWGEAAFVHLAEGLLRSE